MSIEPPTRVPIIRLARAPESPGRREDLPRHHFKWQALFQQQRVAKRRAAGKKIYSTNREAMQK